MTTASEGETEELGGRLAAVLAPGDIVAVSGELGAGKTTFVRGACRALGVTSIVSSPTYTIGHRYEGRVPVAHLDLYRLEGIGDERWGDLEPYFDGTIAFVEWPEHAGGWLPAARATVTLAHVDPTHRRITIESDDDLRFDTATSTAGCALVRDGEPAGERFVEARSVLAAAAELTADAGIAPARDRCARGRDGPGQLHLDPDRARDRAGARARARDPGRGCLDAARPSRAASRSSTRAAARSSPSGPAVCRPEELEVEGLRLVGDGAVRYRELFEAAGAEIPDRRRPGAPSLRAAPDRAGRASFGPAEAIEPLYLRAPDAVASR